MKQYSEQEWAQMSEKQRQHMIARQKLKEKKLRRQGKYEEIEAMLAGVKDLQAGKVFLFSLCFEFRNY